MAIDSERTLPAGRPKAYRLGAVDGLAALAGARSRQGLGIAAGWLRRLRAIGRRASWTIGRVFAKLPTNRFFTSLARRIFIANLLGLLFLIGGILYFSQSQAWLINAKRESLRVQGEIIAAAIAANAKVVGADHLTLDPDQLPSAQDARIPFRDDAFAALELSISPEKVTPILRRLIKPTNTRARIYSRGRTLVVDSDNMLGGRGLDFDTQTVRRPGSKPSPMRSFWTRMIAWFSPNQMPVYKEIDSADGHRYSEVRVAMTGVTTEMVLVNDEGQQIVSLATPIKRSKTVHGVLLLSTRPGEIDEIINEEQSVILMVSAMALLTTILASALLNQTISRPMKKLSAAAEHVRHNIKARTELPEFPNRTDEVGQMAKSFRDMTAALYRRIEASEKFAADVAHELKNPLAAARGSAEALAYVKDEKQRAELAQQFQNELQRLNRLITDVANASRLDAELALQQTEPVDLREVLTNVTGVFKDIEGTNGCRIELDIPKGGNLPGSGPPQSFVVAGHAGRLAQVVTNLVDNAVSFSPEQGIVRVSVRREGDEIELRVEDQGQGIPADKLEAIFKRFYSDRPSTEGQRGKNSGLGLSISQEIIRAHEGRIWAENRGKPLPQQSRSNSAGHANRRGAGSAFVVRLPAASPANQRGGRIGRWS